MNSFVNNSEKVKPHTFSNYILENSISGNADVINSCAFNPIK